MGVALIVIGALALVIINIVNINKNGYKAINRVRMISLVTGLILYSLLYSLSCYINYQSYDKMLEHFKSAFYMDAIIIMFLSLIVMLINVRIPEEIGWILIILIGIANLYGFVFACMLPVGLFGAVTGFLYLYHLDVLAVSISMILKLRRNIMRVGEFSVC